MHGVCVQEEAFEMVEIVEMSVENAAPDYRAQVVAIYEKHNPDKLDKIDKLMLSNKGKEEALLDRLRAKYPADADEAPPAGVKTEMHLPKLSEFHSDCAGFTLCAQML